VRAAKLLRPALAAESEIDDLKEDAERVKHVAGWAHAALHACDTATVAHNCHAGMVAGGGAHSFWAAVMVGRPHGLPLTKNRKWQLLKGLSAHCTAAGTGHRPSPRARPL